jgi:hypothetical protein
MKKQITEITEEMQEKEGEMRTQGILKERKEETNGQRNYKKGKYLKK